MNTYRARPRIRGRNYKRARRLRQSSHDGRDDGYFNPPFPLTPSDDCSQNRCVGRNNCSINRNIFGIHGIFFTRFLLSVDSEPPQPIAGAAPWLRRLIPADTPIDFKAIYQRPCSSMASRSKKVTITGHAALVPARRASFGVGNLSTSACPVTSTMGISGLSAKNSSTACFSPAAAAKAYSSNNITPPGTIRG
jgi:hypothetical protein